MRGKWNLPILSALQKHERTNPISLHVPGHKNGLLFSQNAHIDQYFNRIAAIDQTELPGLDDLHSPEGAIKEAEELLSEVYKTMKSFFLINGSTVGNLAMIMASFHDGDKVLVQRNSHKSIMNGLELANLNPIFLSPTIDTVRNTSSGVDINEVKLAMSQYPDIKGIILTYPNYYGTIYDIKSIIDFAHSYQIPVLVDEAHGAHFSAGAPFPVSALDLGADIVVHSAHKTLPAMTMGSYIHFNSKLVSLDRLNHYLRIFQSSSPSYPIMASLDFARNYIQTYNNEDKQYVLKQVQLFKYKLSKLKGIKVVEHDKDSADPLKITIQSTMGVSGFVLQKSLVDQTIYIELADLHNVLFVFPLLKYGDPCPMQEILKRIKTAVESIPMEEIQVQKYNAEISFPEVSTLDISYKELRTSSAIGINLDDSVGKISYESIIPYPPGTPLLLRGENITDFHIQQIKKLLIGGASFHGGSLLNYNQILTVK